MGGAAGGLGIGIHLQNESSDLETEQNVSAERLRLTSSHSSLFIHLVFLLTRFLFRTSGFGL